MEKAHYYQTIETSGRAEFKDRGSRFIAYTYPVKNTDDFKKILATVKKEHPKANHHCFAYRLGTDGTIFRSSDAGEPSGTAGRPILGQIDSKNLTDILVVVVRYFGGTLLGVPGLINAYKSAAAMALQVTPVVRKPILEKLNLQFDYTQLNEVMNILKQFDCVVLKQELQLFCSMDIGIPKNRLTETLNRLNDVRNLSLKETTSD
ncbi:YigZ family protein [Niabella ginsenosidivorans]|uniref:YigZ family protein n=1 Tax=Niabella ginsenosidivorans TaxID=1176587 RepID=A0A1A9I0U5_9BACT|nr:YigZ family protein [Niabella ginsenosidivorans]ANH81246.1 YigZ family protein [Niabella ginsenosidivorans]